MRFVCILPSFCIVLRSHALYFCFAYIWCSGARRFLLIFIQSRSCSCWTRHCSALGSSGFLSIGYFCFRVK